ncbi:hypothetical protein [Saccharopolyspora aridisoli]|nr:hypothetical protein [Saccharopolyspora aridisoli]
MAATDDGGGGAHDPRGLSSATAEAEAKTINDLVGQARASGADVE